MTPRQNAHWASKRSKSPRDPPSVRGQIRSNLRQGKVEERFFADFIPGFFKAICVLLVNGNFRYKKNIMKGQEVQSC